MCGIAGFTTPGSPTLVDQAEHADTLGRMVAALHHRGPDALTGLLVDHVALGHARLAIVDVDGGAQPMRDPDTGVTVVFNGEIFNHVELRASLAGHYDFRSRSDTEVILAAYRAHGIDAVGLFNGQFAFALYDPRTRSLHLARDRYGKRPLYYTHGPGGLRFASEAKALFAADRRRPGLDLVSLWETLHLWAPTEGRSMYEGVHSLAPGRVAHLDRANTLRIRRYWDLDLDDDRVDPTLDEATALDQLGALLDDAVALRLRADVPVAAYLSGGIDSSLLCAIAQRQLGGTLQTFSVGFEHDRFDETGFQVAVAEALGTTHHAVRIADADIGTLLPDVVDHAEAVLLRSAPAPLLRLSRLVAEHGTKVVLTGEGADEILGGYDLFREAKVRQFWARDPGSTIRPALLGRLYPYLDIAGQGRELVREFYGVGLDDPGALTFSHQLRWSSSARIARFLAPDVLAQVRDHDPVAALVATVPARVHGWRPLARAQYLEVRTLLSSYLLSAQGDRMLMAGSVEGRFPFLDHRLAEWAARLPDWLKIRGLGEKYLLKKYATGRVPAAVVDRPKYPYRAPIAGALTGPTAPAWCRGLLGRDALDGVGVFDGAKVTRLVAKLAARPGNASEADAMALMAIASTQLLATRPLPRSCAGAGDVAVDIATGRAA